MSRHHDGWRLWELSEVDARSWTMERRVCTALGLLVKVDVARRYSTEMECCAQVLSRVLYPLRVAARKLFQASVRCPVCLPVRSPLSDFAKLKDVLNIADDRCQKEKLQGAELVCSVTSMISSDGLWAVECSLSILPKPVCSNSDSAAGSWKRSLAGRGEIQATLDSVVDVST